MLATNKNSCTYSMIGARDHSLYCSSYSSVFHLAVIHLRPCFPSGFPPLSSVIYVGAVIAEVPPRVGSTIHILFHWSHSFLLLTKTTKLQVAELIPACLSQPCTSLATDTTSDFLKMGFTQQNLFQLLPLRFCQISAPFLRNGILSFISLCLLRHKNSRRAHCPIAKYLHPRSPMALSASSLNVYLSRVQRFFHRALEIYLQSSASS